VARPPLRWPSGYSRNPTQPLGPPRRRTGPPLNRPHRV